MKVKYKVLNYLVCSEERRRFQSSFDGLEPLNVFRLKETTTKPYISYRINTFMVSMLTTACGNPFVKSLKATMICSFVFVVLKSFEELPSALLIPSIRKPKVAVEDIVSLHTIYRGFVTPFILCSSSVGAPVSIWHIFSYISYTTITFVKTNNTQRNFDNLTFLNLGFSLAFANSSSR